MSATAISRAAGSRATSSARGALRSHRQHARHSARYGPLALRQSKGVTEALHRGSTRMKAHIRDMPEESTGLRGWLERQLVAEHFLEVLAEFQALADTSSDSTSLDEILAEQRVTILSQGLAALNDT